LISARIAAPSGDKAASTFPRLEHLLPAHRAIAATLRFRKDYKPRMEVIHEFLNARGLSIPLDTMTITHDLNGFELQCLISVDTVARSSALGRIALELPEIPEIESFTVTPSSRT
jgi:hypothetical protein